MYIRTERSPTSNALTKVRVETPPRPDPRVAAEKRRQLAGIVAVRAGIPAGHDEDPRVRALDLVLRKSVEDVARAEGVAKSASTLSPYTLGVCKSAAPDVTREHVLAWAANGAQPIRVDLDAAAHAERIAEDVGLALRDRLLRDEEANVTRGFVEKVVSREIGRAREEIGDALKKLTPAVSALAKSATPARRPSPAEERAAVERDVLASLRRN